MYIYIFYYYFYFLAKLIVSRIHTILATLRRDCSDAGTNKEAHLERVIIRQHKQAAQTQPTKQSSNARRQLLGVAHLRTLGPIIQALCRNTQCLQHPAQHPTWCH